LEWKGELHLEGVVLEVLPTVTFSNQGDLIVADLAESRIRRHDWSGRLLAFIDAWDRFGPLACVLWIPGDSIVAYSPNGTFAIFDSTGRSVRTGRTGLSPLYAAFLVNDSTVLLAGRVAGARDTTLLHEWDLRRELVVRSFFHVPPHDPQLNAVYAYSGSTAIGVREDSIVATFARADTVYIFDTAGQLFEKIPIPFTNFRHVKEPPPVQDNIDSRRRWRASFSTVSHVFWAPDGSFFIQYFDLFLAQPRWNLLHMSRDGQLLFDAADTPRLLTVLPDYRLLFVGTELESGIWKIAELRVPH
jgi:hypothetical protein